MRALGPGSVSSFLKVVLDVAYVALWAIVSLTLIGAISLLIFQPFTANAHFHVTLVGESYTNLLGKTPQVSGLLVLVAAYLGALVVIVNRLRKVFETLIQGDPFRVQNVGRLRVIGLGLILLEGLGYIVHVTADLIATPSRHVTFLNLTTWFAILVVFVLAEVFREGARLRDEAELTI